MNIYIAIIWVHFLSDFILQSNKMAMNKSKDVNYLIFHCIVYSIPLFIFGWEFAIFNSILHFFVDYITSKITSYFWIINQRHWFFVTIGFDQALHLTCLFLSISYI